MKYMVLTTRHHDGFSLFDSKASDFTSAKTAARRDFVAEYVDACRNAGLKVGLYYSLTDWRWRECVEGTPRVMQHENVNSEIVDYVHEQVRELCANYGKIDIMWYDGPWPYDADAWRAEQLNAMVRKHQPGILINNRAGTDEDFGTPEQQISPEKKGRMWEACMTMNGSWGYHAYDRNWKSPGQIIGDLAQCAGGAGNLLLNVGPKPDGSIPPQSVSRLKEVGRWLAANGESIYGSERSPYLFQSFGLMTVKGNCVYLHPGAVQWPGICVGGIKNRVIDAAFLASGERLKFDQKGERLFLRDLPSRMPDKWNSVIKLTVEGKPETTDKTTAKDLYE
jgi:alpha-L-fucosidase